jgi:hypothetical protein
LYEQVVVEQYRNGRTWERDIAKVVTLASPSYKAPDVELPGLYLSSQPVVGVSWSARGAQLFLLDVEQRLLKRVEALSEEALLGIISSTGMAALLLHINPYSTKVGCGRAADAEQHCCTHIEDMQVHSAALSVATVNCAGTQANALVLTQSNSSIVLCLPALAPCFSSSMLSRQMPTRQRCSRNGSRSC